METSFAPTERYDKVELLEDYRQISDQNELKIFLDVVPVPVLVLTETRQIVYANEPCLRFMGAKEINSILGHRPGESINCIHSYENKAGCGTTESCRECGAIKAVLESRAKKTKTAHETRISLLDGEALDLLVIATPYFLNGKEYTIATITDISSEKRRRALERIFFHDVLNTAGVLRNYYEIIQISEDPEEKKYFLEITGSITMNLIEEIKAQKNLSSLESNDYELELTQFKSIELIKNVKEAFRHRSIFCDKKIEFSHVEDINIFSDKTLIRRVLFNLVKNALEAIDDNESVSIGCSVLMDEIAFHIHNPGVMPQNVKLQIFQRSFSTKGSGRGLGTYSVKLLTEKYLKGRVYFESNEESGTTFYAIFPLRLE